MDLNSLMEHLASEGASVLIKADHERYAEGGRYWTLLVSGGPWIHTYVRAEEKTLTRCLRVGLTQLLNEDPHWDWVSLYLDELDSGKDWL